MVVELTAGEARKQNWRVLGSGDVYERMPFCKGVNSAWLYIQRGAAERERGDDARCMTSRGVESDR
jgi:hypothetical protein